MCGIGGILRVHPPGSQPPPPEVAIPEAWLDLIDDSIKHRGPDGKGRFRDRALRPDGSIVDVAFVHRRLSIIDHAGGHQPMVQGGTALLCGEEGDYRRAPCHNCPKCAELGGQSPGLIAVVFNGCIYNHRELRKELQAAGHAFATDHSDTEVFLHGYRQWGDELPTRLDGMFAFSIWDGAAAELFSARDLTGEKPLYDAPTESNCYLFASTAAALNRTLVRMQRDGDQSIIAVLKPWPQGLVHWLHFGGSPILLNAGISEVEPRVSSRYTLNDRGDGEMVNSDSRGWYEDLPARDSPAAPDRLEPLLQAAVASRLEADTPSACFLSGGIDSSLIAHLFKSSTGSVRTFTVRMPDARYDESPIAERVAGILGAEHATLDCDPRPSEQLPALIQQLGLPFGDSSLLPTHWVSAAARRYVKVALAGDGGDELFGGYERHRAHALLKSWSPVLGLLPSVLATGAHPKSRRAKLARLSAAARHGYPELVSIFGRDELAMLVGQDARWIGPVRRPTDPLRWDFENYLPSDLLRKTDTASMAVALEVRAPLLSRNLVGYALSQPLDTLMPHHQRKGLLRSVARKYFPQEIVDRPKQGFAIPIGEWFRSDYGELKTLLLDHLNSTEPWGSPSLGIDLNMKFVRQMLDEHLGTGPSGLVRRDHSQRLYMLLVLSIWAKWLSRL